MALNECDLFEHTVESSSMILSDVGSQDIKAYFVGSLRTNPTSLPCDGPYSLTLNSRRYFVEVM